MVSAIFCVGCSDDAQPVVAGDAAPDVVGIDTGFHDVGIDAADSATSSDSGSEPDASSDAADDATVDSGADTASESGADAATDSGADTASDSGADTALDAEGDSGADTALDSEGDSGGDTALDSGPDTAVDSESDAASDAAGDAATAAWSHTITIDGTNDFTADEKLTTTSSSYDAYVTWDASALYVGYTGGDIGGSASASKWLFVYLDADPAASTGASEGEQYNTQKVAFPSGFAADAYFGWRTDGDFSHFKTYSGGAWSTVSSPGVTVSRSGSFVEMRIPFAARGGATPAKLGVVTFMMNEAGGGEWTYAGLYGGSFTDGHYGAPATVPVSAWLEADLASSAPPSAPANRKP